MAPASKGRIVLVRLRQAGEPRRFNGEDEHPGIVTAVFDGSGGMINVRVFVDGETIPLWETSILHADAAPDGYGGSTWRWPPRDPGPASGARS